MVRFRRCRALVPKNSGSQPNRLHRHWTRLERPRRHYPANKRIEADRRDGNGCATRNCAVANLEKNRSSCFVPINLHLNMRLVVQKYGGTSVGTPERICRVAQRILETQRQGCRVVAVVSAMAGGTDEFLRLAHAVAPQPTKRELDILLSTGEQAAAALTAPASE